MIKIIYSLMNRIKSYLITNSKNLKWILMISKLFSKQTNSLAKMAPLLECAKITQIKIFHPPNLLKSKTRKMDFS